LAGGHGNFVAIEVKKVTALDDDEIFVEVVDMLSRNRIAAARPKRHLAAVRSIKDITLDPVGMV